MPIKKKKKKLKNRFSDALGKGTDLAKRAEAAARREVSRRRGTE